MDHKVTNRIAIIIYDIIQGTHHWEHFELEDTLDDGHFLIGANYYDGNSYQLTSGIWKFDDFSQKFIQTGQRLPTHGAFDWCHFRFVLIYID